MDPVITVCQCACGEKKFEVRICRDEQVALLTCASTHHSLLLDSRDYWMDVIQDGHPKRAICKCGGRLFRVGVTYGFRDSGDVRTTEIHLRCAECSRDLQPHQWDFKYAPTDQLVSRPLDPIDDPWLRPKRTQITCYWRPQDAERFAAFLVQTLGARMFQWRFPPEIVPVNIESTEFLPELKGDLYFTCLTDIAPPDTRDPQKVAPFLRVSSPYHIGLALSLALRSNEGVAHLHYVEYAEEVLVSMRRVKQPKEFIEFARVAREWLAQNFVSIRGKKTADNPDQYARVFGNRS